MVTPLKVDISLLCQTVVHNDLETVRGAKRGHCTRFAIDEKRLDLLFVGYIHLVAKQSPEFVKLDVARGRKHREHQIHLRP